MVDETWDVPDDHFTDDVLCHWKCLKECLTEEERFFVRCRGVFDVVSDTQSLIADTPFGMRSWAIGTCIQS